MTSDILHDHSGRPLSRSESEKRRLEHEAARRFMRAYEKQMRQSIRHIWHNDPAKPDVSCYLQSKKLDLEIAHLYASEQEARIASGDVAGTRHHEHYHGEEHLWAYMYALSCHDWQRKLKESLTAVLASKARKHYNSDRCWLVIRNASPLWQFTDFRQILPHIVLPQTPFEQIWIVPDFPGEQPVLRLLPRLYTARPAKIRVPFII